MCSSFILLSCVLFGGLRYAAVQQVMIGFPVPKCEKALREFRNRSPLPGLCRVDRDWGCMFLRCILLFFAWDQEELKQGLVPFVRTQKQRDILSLFVSACLRGYPSFFCRTFISFAFLYLILTHSLVVCGCTVNRLYQTLVEAAGAETLDSLRYLSEHTQVRPPCFVSCNQKCLST